MTEVLNSNISEFNLFIVTIIKTFFFLLHK